MSNDRIFMVCECGRRRLLLKYYPTGSGVNLQSYILHPEHVEEWMQEHLTRCGASREVVERIPFTLKTEEATSVEDGPFYVEKKPSEIPGDW